MNCNELQMGELDAYVHGELSGAEAETLERHLFGCRSCAKELRQLREEKRLFRDRADEDQEDVPAFADIWARIKRDEAPATDIEEIGRIIVLAKTPRSVPAKAKAEVLRANEGKHGFSRWAQAFVACAATAAAAGSLLSVTPPRSDQMALGHSHGEEMEIGADPICTPENASASAEMLVSVVPPREALTKVSPAANDDFGTCNGNDVVECADIGKICDEEASQVCGESGP